MDWTVTDVCYRWWSCCRWTGSRAVPSWSPGDRWRNIYVVFVTRSIADWGTWCQILPTKRKYPRWVVFLWIYSKKYSSVYFFTLTAEGIMEFWFVKFGENKMNLRNFMSAVKFMIRFRIKTPFILLNCYEEITWFSTLTRGIESIRSTCKLAERLFLQVLISSCI